MRRDTRQDPPNAQPNWLNWARKIQAIAQNGLAFAENNYDRERYAELRELALEIFSVESDRPIAEVASWFSGQPGYATPKVDVRGSVFRDGRILLVRERSDGKWCLPGGWADVGDAPAAAAEREVREEAGVIARARKLIGVFDANRQTGQPLSAHHGYKLIFLCEASESALDQPRTESSHEILDVAFFARDSLPPLSEARTDERHFAECFAHFDDPSRSTAFD